MDDATSGPDAGDAAPETRRIVDRNVTGPLSREDAAALLDQGAALLEAGEFGEALATYLRVVGFNDPQVTAAALLGSAQARYRLDDEDAAVRTWEAILELPETTSTYHAWRNVAAARVREGDLNGAIAAYREADRRAPAADKPEIANRLGWLAKETGNVRASRRYFARGRGSAIPTATWAILGVTVAVSVAAAFAQDGGALYEMLWLDKVQVAHGEIWRLLTVALLHGEPGQRALLYTLMHLGLNMYALYLVGPTVERIYGSARFALFYVLAAIGGSLATYAFGSAQLGTGASGAIFGMFGATFVATRLHLPVLDLQSRRIASQVGTLIVLNILIGFSLGFVDNVAHIGGLVTGGLLAAVFVPGRVATVRSMWQPGSSGRIATGFLGSAFGRGAVVVVLVALFAVAWVVGTDTWKHGRPARAQRATVTVALAPRYALPSASAFVVARREIGPTRTAAAFRPRGGIAAGGSRG
jgi:membrane associated rhomboid family serine protease